MATKWSETDLAAFLDGALEGEERARIAALIETDPGARACAERLQTQDALLRDAFAAPLSEPTPPRLAAILSDDEAVQPMVPRRRPPAAWAPTALAASIALAVGAALGASWGNDAEPGAGPAGGLAVGPASPRIAALLDQTPSGASSDGARMIASFPLPSGAVCREFETLAGRGGSPYAFALACKRGDAWRVLMVATTGAPHSPSGDAFITASGVALDAASPILDALGAGAAMTPDEERRAIDLGWR